MLELKTEQKTEELGSKHGAEAARWKNSGEETKNSLPECSTSMIQSTTGFPDEICSP